MRERLALALLSLTAVSCGSVGEKATTQVMVMVTADAALVGDSRTATKVRFQIIREDETEIEPTTVELEGRDITPDGEPLGFAVVPKDGDATRTLHAVVELLEPSEAEKEGQQPELRVLATQDVSTSFVADELREVWVNFDESCSYITCADGFRCEEGRCVEHCVEPLPRGDVTRSIPTACDEPCPQESGEAYCVEKRLMSCDAGFRVLERECGIACDSETKACEALVPSNLGSVDLPSDLGSLVIGKGSSLTSINIIGTNPADQGILFIGRDAIVFVDGEMKCGAEPCDPTVPKIEFRKVQAEQGENCAGDPLEYAVFFMRSLRLLPGASMVLGGHPMLVVAEEDIVIEGAAQTVGGGCPGGSQRGSDGQGEGAGMGGVQQGSIFSGGGGGSYGGYGGLGGNGRIGPGDFLPGGQLGEPYGTDQRLVPLLVGSGGGAGGGSVESGAGAGGLGGGAIQLTSITGRVLIREGGSIAAAGFGGKGSMAGGGGGGGGSGGAILIEAGELTCGGGEVVHLAAPGGGGGGGGPNSSPGADGDLHNFPAEAGGGELGTGQGGRGSGAEGDASDGRLGNPAAGGGGGGAGRIRINTTEGRALCDEPQPCGKRLEPLSCGGVTQ